MNAENANNKGGNTQITFKLSPEERKQIEQDAAKFGISLSEYCRGKCLLDANAIFQAKVKASDLEKENLTLRMKLDIHKESERSPLDIILPLASLEQREILEELFSGFEDRMKGLTIGENILIALIRIILWDKVYDAFFYSKPLTQEEIEDAFYPDDDEEGYFKLPIR